MDKIGRERDNFFASESFGRSENRRTSASRSLFSWDLLANAVVAGFKEEGPAKIHWGTEKAFVASSGDLGVSIGTIRPNEPPKTGEPDGFPFFTVWKREKPGAPWRYIAE